jgi:predicted ArsR family transcriptional regulator
VVNTRRELLLQLRKHPGITVAALAQELGLTGMGVRRHLDALAADGLVETVTSTRGGLGRPASGWKLTPPGLELFPRRYDTLALDVLEDLAEHAGAPAVDAVFDRRGEKLAAEYEDALAGCCGLRERATALAAIRDEAGYVAECSVVEGSVVEGSVVEGSVVEGSVVEGSVVEGDGEVVGEVVLTENNCAVHRVAERYPAICAMELRLLRRVMGPDVDVTRVAHTMAGDAVCAYRMRKRSPH